jgi:Flp pilus assembly pilin Flp
MGLAHDRGASAVEYGLPLAAVTTLIAATVLPFGRLVRQAFDHNAGCVLPEVDAQ